MKIFKVDGSFIDKQSDTDFGWYLGGSLSDENKKNVTNGEFSENTNSSNDEARYSPELDFLDDDSLLSKESMIKFLSDGNNCKDKFYRKFETIQTAIPSREKLADLIESSHTLEENVLQTVLIGVENEQITTGNVQSRNSPKRVISDYVIDKKLNLDCYQSLKPDTVGLSLSKELLIAEYNISSHNVNTKIGTYQCDSSQSNNILMKNNHFWTHSTMKFHDNSVEEDHQHCYKGIEDLTTDIINLSKSFGVLQIRVDVLINEARSLLKDIKETMYLDDLIELLNGDSARTSTIKLPFREAKDAKPDETNFII